MNIEQAVGIESYMNWKLKFGVKSVTLLWWNMLQFDDYILRQAAVGSCTVYHLEFGMYMNLRTIALEIAMCLFALGFVRF